LTVAAATWSAAAAFAVDKGAESAKEKDAEGWVSIFDGKSLKGWKASEKPENWTVEDGSIVGHGTRSHLFYTDREFADCEFKAEVKLNKGGNSGMYFRTEFGPEWPKGYEAQVNNSGGDPIRTGSLYKFATVKEQLVPDDTWWTQHVIARGNHIVIKVNDKVVVDFMDEKSTYKKGHLALQQHDPGSVVHYRKLMVKPLPTKSGK
jgi:hypothetical protein